MLPLFYPYEYVESAFCIDYEKLFDRGYRGLIFDIDNTLVPHGEDSTPQVDAFFKKLHAIGFRTLLLSNNDEERVLRFLRGIDSLYICDANKPAPKGYRLALEKMGLSRKETLYIGDQVFTDILGANLAGIPSILVRFIGADTATHLGKRRTAEKMILQMYKKDTKRHNRLGDICLHRS